MVRYRVIDMARKKEVAGPFIYLSLVRHKVRRMNELSFENGEGFGKSRYKVDICPEA